MICWIVKVYIFHTGNHELTSHHAKKLISICDYQGLSLHFNNQAFLQKLPIVIRNSSKDMDKKYSLYNEKSDARGKKFSSNHLILLDYDIYT